MGRALIAARLSKLQPDGQQGIGIETQDEQSRAYCLREGHEVVDIVADNASGTKAPWDRPNLRPWVTDPTLMAEYDIIVAYRNDRLSRGAWEDEVRIRLWAQENSKRLIIVDGPQWPPRHDGDAIHWEVMAKEARRAWEENVERVTRALAELQKRGKLVGRPPFGYVSIGEKYNHEIVPTEDGRRYIPQIFERCIAGQSLRAICAWLTSEEVWPVSGVWWPRRIAKLLRNPTYMGYRLNAAGKTVLTCEPLVDANTFRCADVALNRGTGRGPTRPEGRAILTPFCPGCAWSVADHVPTSPMYRIKAYDGYYYRCSGTGPMRKGCTNLVDLETADRLVSDFLAEFEAPIYRTLTVPGSNYEKELAQIDFELKGLASQELSEEDEDARRTELRAERKRLAGLEPVPACVKTVPTGRTFGEEWRGLTTSAERRTWVAARQIRCYVARTDRGTAQAAFVDLALQAFGAGTLLQGDGLSVVVTWLGSGMDEMAIAA